jgi:hypothetical protein
MVVGHHRVSAWTRREEGNQRTQPLHDPVHVSVLSLHLQGAMSGESGGKWGHLHNTLGAASVKS